MKAFYEARTQTGTHISFDGITAQCGENVENVSKSQCFSSALPAGLTCPACDDWCWNNQVTISGNGVTQLMVDLNAQVTTTKRLVAIGDETGVTAVAAEWQEQLEAERREMADNEPYFFSNGGY